MLGIFHLYWLYGLIYKELLSGFMKFVHEQYLFIYGWKAGICCHLCKRKGSHHKTENYRRINKIKQILQIDFKNTLQPFVMQKSLNKTLQSSINHKCLRFKFFAEFKKRPRIIQLNSTNILCNPDEYRNITNITNITNISELRLSQYVFESRFFQLLAIFKHFLNINFFCGTFTNFSQFFPIFHLLSPSIKILNH